MAERHLQTDSRTVTLLAYNTWLIDPPLGISAPLDRSRRIGEIGRALDASGADIMGLVEVFKEKDGEEIEGHLAFQFESARGPGPDTLEISSGLHAIVRRSASRIRGGPHTMVFEAQGGFPDKFAQKGVLHLEIDVGPGCVDFFLTHTYAPGVDERPGRSPVREKQTRELLTFIARHRKPENVVVVAGDFNVDGRKREYAVLLEMMAAERLRDTWLTRGSRLGATASVDDYDGICALDAAREYCRDFKEDGDPTPQPADDQIPGYRLDYIFVEDPRESHTLSVDLGRVRRRPFWRGSPLPTARFTHTRGGDEIPNYLSDHIGLEVTLVASPAGSRNRR